MNDNLVLSAAVELTAAKGDKPARIAILAYSGQTMNVPPWGVVVVDLSGCQLPATIPILADHDNRLAGLVGTGTPEVRSGQLHVNGTLTRANPAAVQIISMAGDGIALQASIGLAPERNEYIPEGQSRHVNGQDIPGPFRLITASRLREVSLTPAGCDSATAVSIAASHSSKGTNMDQNQTQTQTQTTEPNDVDVLRANAAAEFARIGRINELCARFPSIGERAIREGLDPKDVELEVLRASRQPTQTVHAGSVLQAADRSEVLQCAFMRHLNGGQYEQDHFNESVRQQAHELRATSFIDILKAAWSTEAMGRMPATVDGLLRASFSQALISNILDNTCGKIAQSEWRRMPLLSIQLSKLVGVKDFKENAILRLEVVDSMYEELSETGEIRHGSLADSKTAIQANTYSKMFALTRKDLVNDDLGMLEQLPKIVAGGAGSKLESLYWSTIMGAATFFTSENGNLIADVLSTEGLGAAVAAMRNQTDREGQPILLTPKTVVVPPTLEATADGIFASLNLVVAGDTDRTVTAGNVFRGKYQPACSPYLENASYAGSSSTGWYLFADPNDAPATVVCFLNGQQTPTIESADVDFNKLGMQIRGYHDFGVALVNTVAAVKSTGLGS